MTVLLDTNIAIAAIAMRESAEYIITRNASDFANSPVPALSPADFLARMEKKSV
jgi:hypothetical protein